MPSGRALEAVLREKLAAQATPLAMVVGTCVSAGPSAAYMVVALDGVNVTVPKLAHVTVSAGKPVYLLSSRDFLLAIGYVST